MVKIDDKWNIDDISEAFSLALSLSLSQTGALGALEKAIG